jgi:hypothetical protein
MNFILVAVVTMVIWRSRRRGYYDNDDDFNNDNDNNDDDEGNDYKTKPWNIMVIIKMLTIHVDHMKCNDKKHDFLHIECIMTQEVSCYFRACENLTSTCSCIQFPKNKHWPSGFQPTQICYNYFFLLNFFFLWHKF